MNANDNKTNAASASAASNDDMAPSNIKQMLADFINEGFDGDANAAAVVLGRDPANLRSILDGATDADDDLGLKIRGIAKERGVELSNAPIEQ